MATDAELRLFRKDFRNILYKISLLETAIQSKVSSRDTANLLTDIRTIIESFNSRLESLENFYNNLHVSVTKLLLSSPNLIYTSTYTAPIAASTLITLAVNETDTTERTTDFPRRASVSFSGPVSGDYVIITGTDMYGTNIETTVSVGSTYTLFVLRTITKIDASNLTTGTVTVGWSNWIGVNCSEFTRIIEQRVDGVIETVSNSDSDYGAVLFGTTPNGVHNYEVIVVI